MGWEPAGGKGPAVPASWALRCAASGRRPAGRPSPRPGRQRAPWGSSETGAGRDQHGRPCALSAVLRLLVRPCRRLRCPGDAATWRPEEAGRVHSTGSGGGPAEGGARLEPVRGPGWRALSPGKGRGPVGGTRPRVSLEIPQGLSPNTITSCCQTQVAAFLRSPHSPLGAGGQGCWSISPERWDWPRSQLECPRTAEPREVSQARSSQPAPPTQVPGVPDTLANPAERQEEAGVQEHLCVPTGPQGAGGGSSRAF